MDFRDEEISKCIQQTLQSHYRYLVIGHVIYQHDSLTWIPYSALPEVQESMV